MTQHQYTYAPQGQTLDRYITDRGRRTFISGPLGSGKTNASCWRLFRLLCEQAPDAHGLRKSRWACIRNTYPDLLTTTTKDWLEMFEALGRWVGGGQAPPTHHLAFALDDGTTVNAEVVFLALDRSEHVRKLRGTQLTGAWLNEAKELPFAVLEMIDLRVGRYPIEVEPTWHGIFGDTNAPDTDHWYYRLAEVDKPRGWTFFKQPGGLIRSSAQSPWVFNEQSENVHNLPGRKAYYTDGASGKTEDWIKVNLANEYGYVMDGKAVYPDYSDSLHCREFDLVPSWGVHIGLDFGLTPAALIGQKTPSGHWRWRYELVTESTGIKRFAGELKRFIDAKLMGVPILSITGDPAGNQRQAGDSDERTVFDMLAAEGVQAQPAITNNFTTRVEAFAQPMRQLIDGTPAFMIHPDCKVSRKGLAGAYHYRRMQVGGDQRFRDVPEKNDYSHPLEAGQYAALGAGDGITIRSVPISQQDIEAAKRFRSMRGLA